MFWSMGKNSLPLVEGLQPESGSEGRGRGYYADKHIGLPQLRQQRLDLPGPQEHKRGRV